MEKFMRKKSILNSHSQQTVVRYLFVNLVGTLILAGAQPTLAQTQQKTFVSAEQASQALYDAVWTEDDHAVQAILDGKPGAAELTTSGNDDEDKLEREHFARKYQEMHRLVREADGSMMLYIGAENWPFPIPLTQSDGKWHFDSDSGSLELQARAIGENETAAIQACQAVGNVNSPDANKTGANDPVLEFARDLVRSETADSAPPKAFHGYDFRFLKGKSGDTFLVAYPAEYGASGVMTFVLARGVVYERDLGPQTATAAQKLQGKPGAKWEQVQRSEPF